MESKQEVATEDWHDITGEFFDCLKDLELGELTRGTNYLPFPPTVTYYMDIIIFIFL